jgi:hypothetical protein
LVNDAPAEVSGEGRALARAPVRAGRSLSEVARAPLAFDASAKLDDAPARREGTRALRDDASTKVADARALQDDAWAEITDAWAASRRRAPTGSA